MTSVVVVTGSDPSLVGRAAREVIDELAGDQPHSLVVEDVGGEDVDVSAVVDACRTPPFLGDRRVVVVRDVGRLTSSDVTVLLEYLESPLDSTSLVLVAGQGTTPQKLLNAAKKSGRVVATADTSRANERRDWLAERLDGASVSLDRQARDTLSDHLGEDLSRLPSLLQTLEATYGEGARVGVRELEPFLGEAGGVAPWALTDAIDGGDYRDAIAVLRRLIAAGRHPLQLLAILHRHYAAMLRLDGTGIRSNDEAAALLGSKPFSARKTLNQAQRLGSRGVQQAIVLLAEADLDVRGAREWPPEMVLEVLVARLCQLARRS